MQTAALASNEPNHAIDIGVSCMSFGKNCQDDSELAGLFLFGSKH